MKKATDLKKSIQLRFCFSFGKREIRTCIQDDEFSKFSFHSSFTGERGKDDKELNEITVLFKFPYFRRKRGESRAYQLRSKRFCRAGNLIKRAGIKALYLLLASFINLLHNDTPSDLVPDLRCS